MSHEGEITRRTLAMAALRLPHLPAGVQVLFELPAALQPRQDALAGLMKICVGWWGADYFTVSQTAHTIAITRTDRRARHARH